MEALNEIKALIPDYAKDVRINLDSTIARSSLPAQEALGVALAAAYAAKSPRLVTAFRAALPEVEANAAADRRCADGDEQCLVPVRGDDR